MPDDKLTYDRELGPAFFIQMPYEIIEDTDISHGAFRLYSHFLIYCRQGTMAWPGQKSLAEKMGCSDRYIRSLLDELKSVGLLDWETSWDPVKQKRFTTYQVRKLPLRQRQRPDSQAATTDKPPQQLSVATTQTARNKRTTTNRNNTSGSNRNNISAFTPETNRNQSSDETQALIDIKKETHMVCAILIKLFNADQAAKLAARALHNGRNAQHVQELVDHVAQRPEIKSPAAYVRLMIEENNDLPDKRPKLSAKEAQERKKRASWLKAAGKK